MNRTKAIDIQIGDKTHHQDQLITPHSFSTIKTIARSPPKLIPLDDPFVFDIIKPL